MIETKTVSKDFSYREIVEMVFKGCIDCSLLTYQTSKLDRVFGDNINRGQCRVGRKVDVALKSVFSERFFLEEDADVSWSVLSSKKLPAPPRKGTDIKNIDKKFITITYDICCCTSCYVEGTPFHKSIKKRCSGYNDCQGDSYYDSMHYENNKYWTYCLVGLLYQSAIDDKLWKGIDCGGERETI